jgi:hypothetical protein
MSKANEESVFIKGGNPSFGPSEYQPSKKDLALNYFQL